VQVVLDRRQAERRSETAATAADHRAADRRQLGIDQALRARGLAVVISR